MINHKEAMRKVSGAFPNRVPSAVFDYDRENYIVAAPLRGVPRDFDGAFFSVNKVSGKVSVFFPGEDYDKFFDAIDNRLLR